MPRYKITSPSGVSMIVTGDQPPSQEAAAEIFNKVGTVKQEAAPKEEVFSPEISEHSFGRQPATGQLMGPRQRPTPPRSTLSKIFEPKLEDIEALGQEAQDPVAMATQALGSLPVGIPKVVSSVVKGVGKELPGRVGKYFRGKQVEDIIRRAEAAPAARTQYRGEPTPGTDIGERITQLPPEQVFQAGKGTAVPVNVVKPPPKPVYPGRNIPVEKPPLIAGERQIPVRMKRPPLVPEEPKPTMPPPITNPDTLLNPTKSLPQSASTVQPAQPPPRPGAPPPPPPVSDNFVNEAPIRFDPDISTGAQGQKSKDVRFAYGGDLGLQETKGTRLAKTLRKLVPNADERAAMTIMRDVDDPAVLQAALLDPKLKDYHHIIKRALNLSTEAGIGEESILKPYFSATGAAGQKWGFLDNLREHYINRMFEKSKSVWQGAAGQGVPVTGARTIRSGALETAIPTTTPHALQRRYGTILDRIAAGGKPLTLDAADLLQLYNHDFAKVMSDNKLLNALKNSGLGIDLKNALVAQGGKGGRRAAPAGYETIGNSTIAIPDWLTDGLKAITEPDYTKRIGILRKIHAPQSLVKTVDLSIALFHDFTMVAQSLYQTKFGLELINPKVTRFLKDANYKKLELDLVKDGLGLETKDANLDVLARLATGKDAFARVLRAPGIKQAFDLFQKHNKWLFDDMRRFLKVMDAGKQKAMWMKRNPLATEWEITRATRSMNEEVNSAYGGLFWEGLGRTPSFVGINRLMELAPDWTWSNYYLGKQALTDWRTPGGWKARSHFISALVGAGVMTEGLSKMITGHYTDQNPKGYKTKVEISPGVYLDLFRGAVGDAINLASDVEQGGVLGGVAQLASSKLAPFTKFATNLAANKTWSNEKMYSAEKDFLKNTEDILKEMATTAGPVPFGIASTVQAIKRSPGATVGEKVAKRPLWTYPLIAAGLARSGPSSEEAKKWEHPGERQFLQQLNNLEKGSPEMKKEIDRYVKRLPSEQERKRVRYKLLIKGFYQKAR